MFDLRTPAQRNRNPGSGKDPSVDFQSARKVVPDSSDVFVRVLCGETLHPEVELFINSTIGTAASKEVSWTSLLFIFFLHFPFVLLIQICCWIFILQTLLFVRYKYTPACFFLWTTKKSHHWVYIFDRCKPVFPPYFNIIRLGTKKITSLDVHIW